MDLNDKTVEGWNASAPPLYLWSRPDWTKKHMKIAEEHSHTGMGKIPCHVDSLSDDLVREEAGPSDKTKTRSGKGKENTGKASCHSKEDDILDDLPVRKQAEAANKWNSRSGKERGTDKTACIDGEASLPDDAAAKKQARSEEERHTLGKIAVDVKEANMSDYFPVNKQSEPASKVMPGKERENVSYENRSDDRRKWTPDHVESLPPEKQVEVAYEETKVTIPRKESIHNEHRGACHEYRRNFQGEEIKSARQNHQQTAAKMLNQSMDGGDSDMCISSPDSNNARCKSRSFSPAVPIKHPSDRIAPPDSYCPSELYDPMLNRANFKESYLASNVEYFDEIKYANIDNSSSMRVQEPYQGARTNLNSFQSIDDGSFYRHPSSEDLNTTTGRNLVADVAMQGHGIRYDGHGDNCQVSKIPQTTSSQTHLSLNGGTGAGYPSAKFSLGSSGARFSQPASTPSFGLSGAGLQRGLVMDKYGSGLLGPSGPQSSIMEKYAPSLDGRNYTRPESSLPQQYPSGRLNSYGGGWRPQN